MTRLTILHTNDLHGHVEQVFRIAALAKQIKYEVTTNGGHCVLWDAGDAEDTILYESSMTKGRAMMAVLRGARRSGRSISVSFSWKIDPPTTCTPHVVQARGSTSPRSGR
jgi:hypothetical protein